MMFDCCSSDIQLPEMPNMESFNKDAMNIVACLKYLKQTMGPEVTYPLRNDIIQKLQEI